MRKTVFHFSFLLFVVGSHLMWNNFSSVFNRLRLGCMKSSSESSVSSSSSFSFVSGDSDSGVSGKLCPGNISCNFSSKYRLTALPDIAISDPACRRRRKRGWERKRVKSDMEQAGVRVPLSRRNEWIEAGRRKRRMRRQIRPG